ncbi:Rne/Rng family ribonuclease [Sphingomonas histidinilytica]|uniref:Ribonuclease E n=2 Tax=Rhizorhabdus histidinilytica TaxID=439228 RepID=A0A1T5AY35_9SPHN|nr:ribonuclease E/G [Rhizorhabdus histidinilytica]MBO9377743.1 Rne/Rng family ribonuclease [Rhizorhabdus histidinilytica]QEH79541.1 ribonuclease E/G [Sphingomonas sp. C8-2]SKB39874.1 RNAse E [Rhizorhabdus histidinilytica]
MTTRMLIDARHREETRVAVVQGNRIEEFDFESAERKQLKGNIYLAKVTRVEPSLQAAFVDYGGNRHGFLAFSEIHPDYYQIPKEDREALLREEAEHAAEEEALRAREAEHEDGADEIDGDADHEDDHHHDGDEEDAPRPRRESVGGGSDDGAVENLRQRRMNLRRRYKIQDVIRRRQVLLVQVVKEERGNKGAALTTYLSLAGRYCVLMPNTSHGGGISRKISNAADRKRLKSIMAELNLPKTMGCIVRTAGLQRTKTEIKRDFDYLARLWDEIRENTLKSQAPALIYGDSDLIKRAIRDIYNRDIDEVVVEGEEGYRQARAFMKLLMPSHAKKVGLYADAVPLFQRYGVEDQLAAMYQPIVQLKSGGYLVINPTEALVSIDINSGRSTREHNIEQTATATNLEAAHEIARQLRLRDMAGLIVIDFIDMENNSNIRKVEKAMKEALKNDRARIQVGRISSFGLFEMSRQRLRTGVLEASTRQCPHCEGTGLIRTASSAGLSALRMLEDEAARGRGSRLLLRASQEAAFYVLNRKRAELAEIEERYGVVIEIVSDGTLEGARMSVEAGGPPPSHAPRLPAPLPIEADDDIEEEVEDEEEEIAAEDEGQEDGERGEGGRRRRRRRRRRGGRGRDQDGQGEAGQGDEGGETGEAAEVAEEEREAAEEAVAEDGGGEARGRRRRGRRSGRRRGGEGPEGAEGVEVEGQQTEAAVNEPETAESPAAAEPEAVAEEAAPAEPAPKTRRRPRARKADAAAVAEPVEASVEEAAPAVAEPEAEPVAEAPKPRRGGRRKKADVEAEAAATPAPVEAAPVEAAPIEAAPEPEATPKRRTRSRAKAAAAAPAETVEAAAEAPTAGEAAGETAPAEEAEDGGSPRRGWWQRTFGA